MTHTFVTLDVSATTYDEIAWKLREAGYGHVFRGPDGEIDLHGIGLVRAPESAMSAKLREAAMQAIAPLPASPSHGQAEPLYLVHAGGDGYQAEIVPESKLDDAYLLTQWVSLDGIDPEQRAAALEHFHDDDSWTHEEDTGKGQRVKFGLSLEDGWIEVVRLPARASLPALPSQLQGVECHGLDTPERVCFYEQDFYVLSNFSSFNLVWEGLTFQTPEAAYHWEKFANENDDDTRNGVAYAIYEAPSAHAAFKIAEAQKHLRRHDWDEVKVAVMRDILRAKAEQHEYVRRKLLATGDRYLVENSWRDAFWGWGPNRDGQNMLGKLWMEVRAELRAAPSQPAQGEAS